MTRIMFDSIDVANFPANPQMVAGYVDGRWPNLTALQTRFPNAVHVSITTSYTGTPGAHVIDCETGDSTPQTAAAWAKAELAAGRLPAIYCNGSTWPAVKAEVAALGITEQMADRYWIAAYDGVATIPAGAIAKQYRSDTAQNLDYSVVADYWPGVDGGEMPLTQADADLVAAAVAKALGPMYEIMENGNAASPGHVGLRDVAAAITALPSKLPTGGGLSATDLRAVLQAALDALAKIAP